MWPKSPGHFISSQPGIRPELQGAFAPLDAAAKARLCIPPDPAYSAQILDMKLKGAPVENGQKRRTEFSGTVIFNRWIDRLNVAMAKAFDTYEVNGWFAHVLKRRLRKPPAKRRYRRSFSTRPGSLDEKGKAGGREQNTANGADNG